MTGLVLDGHQLRSGDECHSWWPSKIQCQELALLLLDVGRTGQTENPTSQWVPGEDSVALTFVGKVDLSCVLSLLFLSDPDGDSISPS